MFGPDMLGDAREVVRVGEVKAEPLGIWLISCSTWGLSMIGLK